MRIAIDARELYGQPTGVGRYLAEILAAWDDLAQALDHEVVLCAPGEIAPPPLRRLRVRTEGEHAGVPRRRAKGATAGGTRWEQIALPRLVRRAGADVLFAPSYTGPLRCPAPFVVTIHDVSFAAHPEWFGWKEGLRRRVLTRHSARRAVRVLTISEFSKNEIVRHLGVNSEKVEVIYAGVSSPACSMRDPAGRHGHSESPPVPVSGDAPVILYVGSLFNRRHIPELVAGFGRLAARRSDVRLELVGDNRSVPRIDIDRVVRDTPAPDRIHVRSYIPDDELARLYAGARAFAFLSEYEGFGLTPLEALAAGIPIVVLDTPVAREVYGAAAIYVDRPDPVLVEAALERAIFDLGERARVLGAAPAVLARYSWRECAARVLDVLLASGHVR